MFCTCKDYIYIGWLSGAGKTSSASETLDLHFETHQWISIGRALVDPLVPPSGAGTTRYVSDWFGQQRRYSAKHIVELRTTARQEVPQQLGSMVADVRQMLLK